MARKSSLNHPAVSTAAVAKVRFSLTRCAEQVEALTHQNDLHIKRMAAMQAEIDHLRGLVRS